MSNPPTDGYGLLADPLANYIHITHTTVPVVSFQTLQVLCKPPCILSQDGWLLHNRSMGLVAQVSAGVTCDGFPV